MLILCRHIRSILQPGIQEAFRGCLQKIHCKVDSYPIPSGHLNISGIRSAAGQNDPVKLPEYTDRLIISSHICVGNKGNALLLHQLYFSVNHPFLQLHTRNTVHQKSPCPIAALKHSHQMASLVQLVGSRQPGRAGADNRNSFSGADGGRLRTGKAALVRLFNNRSFIFLHSHRITVQTAGAGSFTGSRAYPGGKLRKAVGFFQTIIGLLPVACIHQIIPFRNQVVQRTAADHAPHYHSRLAKGYSAVHTSGSLFFLLRFAQRNVKLIPVLYSVLGSFLLADLALVF